MNRTLSKLLLVALCVTSVGPLESLLHGLEQTPAVVAEFDDGVVRASTIQTQDHLELTPLQTADLNGGVPAFESESNYLSPVYTADFAFDAVEMDWEEIRPEGTDLMLWARFQGEAGEWSDWLEIHESIDYRDGSEPGLQAASTLVPTARSTAIQYRVTMTSTSSSLTPRLQNMSFHYIDASVQAPAVEDLPTLEKTSTDSLAVEGSDSLTRLTFGAETVDVISRSEWGADETWRLSSFYGVEEEEEAIEETIEEEGIGEEDGSKNGQEPTLQELYPEEFAIERTVSEDDSGAELYWPMDYSENIEKIIVHHTAGELTEDPEATIRAIYYYHAVRRGWGDIGYNYIVANGKVYEGRYGGEKVVGGHASGHNTSTIGIAVIGNYENEPVAFEDLNALASLVREKASMYSIDPDGMSRFHGEVMANILGHQDVGDTLCPGENLYAALPILRDLIANGVTNLEESLLSQTVDEPFAYANVNAYEALMLDPTTTGSFTLQLKNIGQETWTQETYLVANRNANAEALVHLVKTQDSSVAIAYLEEASVEPGETGTFTLSAEAKVRGGFQNFEITPLFNGKTKTSHYLDLPVYVSTPILTYDIVEVDLPGGRFKTGETVTSTVTLKNTGNVDWVGSEGDYPLVLGTTNPEDRESSFLSEDPTRYATLNESVVEPGETGTFTVHFTIPKSPGPYVEYAAPLMEGLDWLEGEDITFQLLVYNPNAQAQMVEKSDDTEFSPGETKSLWVQLENIGDLTWEKDKFTAGKVHNPLITVSKPVLEEDSVAPEETGTFSFDVTAPEESGQYTLYFYPRNKGQNLTTRNLRFDFTVTEETTEVVSDEPDQETIRVKLSYDSATSGNPILSSEDGFTVEVDGETLLTFDGGDEVEVRSRGDDTYELIHGSQAWVVTEVPRFIASGDGILELVSYDNPPSWSSTSDNLYRGRLEVRDDEDTLIVINELSMEYYLKGLAESTNTQPHEKQKAMAVLARTYARYYLEKDDKFPGKPYDASDDPSEFQKYLGYRFESRAPTWVEAVEETAGEVVTYEGELVKTPYFSSTDGTATKSAEEVWGWTHTPYLVSVPDPLCDATAFSGHGVGLSGCGATAAAEAGYTYDEIIKYYYTGVEIEAP